MLLSGVPAGKVVKVTNKQNNKYVFAKVLAAMPAIKNETLVARLSSAAYSVITENSDAASIEVVIE